MIVKKFNLLKNGIREISSGNLDYKFKMEGEDEFVELAGHFNQMGDKLKRTIAEVRDKDRLDHELKIARQVQLNLLPTKLPEIEGYQVAAALKTANEVGGDLYDIIYLDKNKYLFTIGDVSGKGSSAAFYMAQFMSLLRFSPQFTHKPLEIALRLNEYFSTKIVDRQIFITAIIGVLDVSTDTITFVRAGHTPPLMIPGDTKEGIEEISTGGLGIGLTKAKQKFRSNLRIGKVKINPGDKLVFYTDGVVEAAIPGKSEKKEVEVFGDERFHELLQKFRGGNAHEILAAVSSALNSFYADNPSVDDYTLFIIQKSV
jgi:serine phosphatase RsbU (regulator of sigma subunit)